MVSKLEQKSDAAKTGLHAAEAVVVDTQSSTLETRPTVLSLQIFSQHIIAASDTYTTIADHTQRSFVQFQIEQCIVDCRLGGKQAGCAVDDQRDSAFCKFFEIARLATCRRQSD